MTTEKEKEKPFYKQPAIIILTLFLVVFYIVQDFSGLQYSKDPIVFNDVQPPEIMIYGTETCKYCIIARDFFKFHKLAYTDKDIETSIENRNMFDLMQGRGTPMIIINKKVIHGFNEKRIRKAL